MHKAYFKKDGDFLRSNTRKKANLLKIKTYLKNKKKKPKFSQTIGNRKIQKS